MDLTSFTKSDKKESKKEVLLENKDVKIEKSENEIIFNFNSKKALNKYDSFLFFSPTEALVTDSDEKAQKFFKRAIDEKVEGLMFKSLDSIYKPGLRTGSMAKIKETKEDIDLVIVGAEYGKGKRAGFYSSFIVAVKNEDFNDESDRYLEVGKVSSGIKELGDEGHSMANLTKLLEPLKIDESENRINFSPKIIIQVRYQEIQKSTSYASGYALRFPRIIMLRTDKDISEINTVEDIEAFIS